MYSIYSQTNINGKMYVGLTSKTIKKRWSEHCKKARYHNKLNNANYFQRAIIKYGSDNWNAKLLEECGSLQEAEISESKWILHFKSNQKHFGYNLTSGGNVSQSNLDSRVRAKISTSVSELWKSDTYRDKVSGEIKKWHQNNDNPFLGKKHSKEALSKMAEKSKNWHKNNDNPFLGQKHSEETRTKMSIAAQKRCDNPNWKPPLLRKNISLETREKMSNSGKGRKYISACSQTELIELAKKYKTQKEIAKHLECTPANISYLIKRWNIVKQIKILLKE